ncbi:MAG: hypothetical protein ACJ75Z_04530, partial [Solirubrobacterales bacterium]
LDLDEHDRPAGTPGTDRRGVIRPSPPSSWEWTWPKGRQWWLLAPWHVPQPSSFWRRELFDQYGLFRREMNYAFDAEFMVRLALAEELPEFLNGDPLAVRVHHGDAKSADFSRWQPEIQQIVKIHSPSLSDRERRRLPLTRMLVWTPAAVESAHLLAGIVARILWLPPAAHRAFHRALSRVGDLLDLVPVRWRPPIRTRDRRARAGSPDRQRSRA